MRELADFEALSPENRAVVLRRLRTDVRKVDTISSNSGSTRAAVDKLIKSLYTKRASEVVASLVNGSWDGRFCTVSRNWAHRVDGAWDRKAMQKMGVYSTLHPAKLDEIALEMARREM